MRLLFAALLALAACAAETPSVHVPARPALPPADYRTQAGQFAELQRAALAADYAAFAEALGGRGAENLVAELTAAFGGAPFDVYTADARTDAWGHRRLIELRGTAARLYLVTALNASPGGWDVAGYQLGRDRDAIAGRL
jgi:hypothetical protein